jgi:fermentation-respiration switch protein FrsA (DUF1100 family)
MANTLFYIVIALVALTGIFVFYIKDMIIYQPNKIVYNFTHNHKLDNFDLLTPDGTRIYGYHLKNPKHQKVILYCHGNAGNIYTRISMLDELSNFGSIVMFDYRGYGKSTGTPSEKGLYKDTLTVWNYLIKDLKYSPDDVIIFGESLGGGPASWLANHLQTTTPPKKMILRSTFSSIHDMAPSFLKFLTYILPNEFPNCDNLENLNTSILFIHSKEDEIVPFENCEKNMSKTKNKKLYVYYGDHNKHLDGEEFVEFVNHWLANP